MKLTPKQGTKEWYENMTSEITKQRVKTHEFAAELGIPCTNTFINDYPLKSYFLTLRAVTVKYPELAYNS